MMAKDKLPDVVAKPQCCQANKRSTVGFETLREILSQKRSEFCLTSSRIQLPPIFLSPRQLQCPVHYLHRFTLSLPNEGRAQDCVSCHEQAPGACKRRLIEPTVQLTSQLPDVNL